MPTTKATSLIVPALEEIRATLRVKARDPAVLVRKLVQAQHERTVELLDAYADTILARGADPASVCAIRDAADVLAGKLAFSPVPPTTVEDEREDVRGASRSTSRRTSPWSPITVSGREHASERRHVPVPQERT